MKMNKFPTWMIFTGAIPGGVKLAEAFIAFQMIFGGSGRSEFTCSLLNDFWSALIIAGILIALSIWLARNQGIRGIIKFALIEICAIIAFGIPLVMLSMFIALNTFT